MIYLSFSFVYNYNKPDSVWSKRLIKLHFHLFKTIIIFVFCISTCSVAVFKARREAGQYYNARVKCCVRSMLIRLSKKTNKILTITTETNKYDIR